MATLAHVLQDKTHNTVHCVSPGSSVLEATWKMNDHHIGSLLVLDGQQIVGIISERDILQRVVADEKDPRHVTVDDVMTTDVIVCRPCTSLEDASAIMRNRRVRHLPVVDEDGRLLGVISIGDLNARHASEQETTIHYLHEYLYGRV